VALAGSYREGDVDRALRTAAHTFRYEMRIGRSTSAPIETRGYIADWNVDDDTLTVYGACQNPHPMRWVLAQALRILESRVRVVAPNVGGAFGLKMHGHPEEVLLCVLSRLAGAPVKWIEDRRDCFLAGAREQTHRVEVAVHGDGRVAAFRDRFVANVGAMSATPGWGMALVTALTLPTGYRVPHCEIEYTVAVTNKAPWHPTRGYGKEAANLVMERVMDLAARTLGLDPAEVRRRNFIARDLFPYATPTGLNIDSGDYEGVLDKALALIDYPRARREQAALRVAGRLRGVGIAFELTPEAAALPGTLSGGFDASTVRMDPSGNVTVLTGVTSPGGGNETGIAQVVADELGVSVETVSVVQGDTASCPYGFGNSTGRSLVVGGSSAALAARDVKAKLAQVASGALGCDPGELVFAHGRAAVRDDRARSVTMREIAQTVYRRPYSAADMIEPLLEATRVYKPGNIRHTPDDRGRIQPYPTYSNAVHVAVVDVDGDTGQVTVRDYAVAHDCGVMINPTLVEAQMHGAVAMGIGAALFEASAYDRAGRLVSDRFKTYLLPRAGDLPALKVAHHVTPSPFTLLGNKGAGEAGVGGALAAVTNAVDDALAPLGVAVDRVPLRPPVVLALLDRARA